jgi:hypothetical protein
MEGNAEPSNTDKLASRAKPMEASAASDEHTAINSQCDKPTPNDKKHPLEWAIAFMLFGTLIATGFAACYTRKQWRTASDQEQRSLRAYVMVQSSEIGVKDTGELTATITIKNFGSTPAYNVRHWACAMVNRFPDQDIDFPTAAEIVSSYKEAPGSLIPPSGTLGKQFIDPTTCMRKAVSPEDRAAIHAGQKTIFAIGVIKYRDAFHNEWVTDYRRGWDPVNNGVDGYKGNCADEDCPKDDLPNKPVVK